MTEPRTPTTAAGTTAGLQAKVSLRRAWFEAHPNQPMPEGRAEVERLFAAIEADADVHRDCVPEAEEVKRRQDAIAEARAEPRAEGLNVERLARALTSVTRRLLFPGDKGYQKWLDKTAQAIAREYAALEDKHD